MKNLIIVGTFAAMVVVALTSCEKSETAPETNTGAKTTPSQAPHSRYYETFDTEDRPKMVKGHVQNTEKEDIQDASVTIYNGYDNTEMSTVFTDSGGEFGIDSIFGGIYYLVVSGAGYQNGLKELIIPMSEDTIFEVDEEITLMPK